MTTRVHVRTPSRLHFGLLSFPKGQGGPNRPVPGSVPARHFGGVGLMVEAPGIQLAVEPAAAWSAEGPLARRALHYAGQFAEATSAGAAGVSVQPCRLVIARAPPEHIGLGTGTQLALAVARGLAAAWGWPEPQAVELARRVGRGLRSALGIHGFAAGGFLVEAGKRDLAELAPLVARAAFPEPWRLVLLWPRGDQGLHGTPERQAFERLDREGVGAARTDALCRLVLLGMLPALAERDFPAFGEALYEFNRLAGEAFAADQGGTYASPRIAEWVRFIRGQGLSGAGQSSWGPTVFAVAEHEEQAQDLLSRLGKRFGRDIGEAMITRACNRGAVVEVGKWPDD